MRKILVVGPAWVGDMVMAQSLFITLKRQYPHALIDVLAPGWSLPILARMPEVSDAVEMPLTHGQLGLVVRWQLGRSLSTRGYSHAIVLPRSFKAALVPFFAGIPVRRGYRGELRFGLINDAYPLDKSVLTQTVQRFVALGLPNTKVATVPGNVPLPAMRIDPASQHACILALGLDASNPVLGMMPGAEYGPAKQWPAAHYAALAAEFAGKSGQVWVFGSAREKPLGDEIVALSGSDSVHSLCGKTRLEDVVDLLAACSAVVTNDSGLMHVAGAVDVPVVALYGSSSPDFTPPLGKRHSVVRLGLDCSPCFARTCKFGHYNCLTQIEVGQVMQELRRWVPASS